MRAAKADPLRRGVTRKQMRRRGFEGLLIIQSANDEVDDERAYVEAGADGSIGNAVKGAAGLRKTDNVDFNCAKGFCCVLTNLALNIDNMLRCWGVSSHAKCWRHVEKLAWKASLVVKSDTPST